VGAARAPPSPPAALCQWKEGRGALGQGGRQRGGEAVDGDVLHCCGTPPVIGYEEQGSLG
jgi:hypothetical protein